MAGFALSFPFLLLTVVGCCSTKEPVVAPQPQEEHAESEEEELVFDYMPQEDAIAFGEIWGYVMAGREKEFDAKMPISDVGYFMSAVGLYSEILPVADRDKYFGGYRGRVHVVTSCDSRSQAHLLLDPSLPLRKKIIDGLLQAAKTYDGLQVDWELIPQRDADNFISFLQELRDGLGAEKQLTIAVPARIRTLKDDVFDYARIAPIVDRMIVMAYDEHWSTSAPGAIASLAWCKRIADYAASVIPKEKLVMGLPFYGRTWADYKDINKAFASVGISRIRAENHIEEVERKDGVPYFTYERTIGVTVWYNDIYSLNCHCQLYRDCGVTNIAFWRVGQEDRDFWQTLTLEPQLTDGTAEPSLP